ncbi:hypothetical protein [Vulcanisaeta thermophila]|uniref:hypothetical protein n=1 Tax=Vulcanisaeta thermophila TaxID=867917 RepID=UPI000852F3BC|nr:hypothetical protein [Vulcanisaeta thermophila]
MTFQLSLPIPHPWIIYGAVVLVIEMVIGFAVQFKRGVLSLHYLSTVLPIKGPTGNWGSGAAFIVGLLTAVAYPFYGAPMTSCHTQSDYLRKPRLKAVAHALVWWGFVFAAISTVLGFIFDEWVNETTFIPGGTLGPMGPYAVIGTGTLGGILIIIGFALMMAARWQGTRPIGESAMTDFFLWTAFFTSLSGFALMGVELTVPNNFYAVSTAFTVHMFIVTMMFATMPWSKFGHAILTPLWVLYDKYKTLKGPQPRLLGPWSGELAEKALESHVPSHPKRVH